MSKIAVIGGSGFYSLEGMQNCEPISVATRYGENVEVNSGSVRDQSVLFIARHGAGHVIPPHKINYRANIDALSQLGVEHIIAINAVGSMHKMMSPGTAVIPNQLIDYSWGREQTFFDEFSDEMMHIDFTNPLDSQLRYPLYENLRRYMPVVNSGVYACVQGPRLETAAEILKYQRDGCDLVGMTMMPEAALAREKNISYISVCFVCNWAAGFETVASVAEQDSEFSMASLNFEDIKAVLAEGLTKVQKALLDTLTFF